jgi:PAS domain S-box-containing protein
MTTSTNLKKAMTDQARMLLFIDEIEPEHWSLWARIGLAAGYLILSTYIFISDHLFPDLYVIQLCAVAAIILYSGVYLLFYNKNHIKMYLLFALIFFDVAIVTFLNASATLLQAPSSLLSVDLFSAYLIIILFNGLHNRKRLPLFCGALSLTSFIALYHCHVYQFTYEEGTYDFISRVTFIIVATSLATIAAHRNFFIMKKVISSETRYQKLVHRLPEMLFTLDLKGKIIWTSKASSAILGIDAKAMPNRMMRDFLKEPGLLKLDKTEFKATLRLNDRGSGIKFVDCFMQPLKEEGEESVFEGIMTDVTDREIAIFQREEMVNRLYQYQKMESLGTLAAGMAHDFNNILQKISDIVSHINSETGEPSTKKSMLTISEDLIDAKFLINELLAIGRKQPLDLKPIHLQAFFSAIIPQFRKQLSNGAAIECHIPDKPLWIQGDPDYFKRVIQNLVDNAYDSMLGNRGCITIECCLQKNTGKSNMAIIRIIDEGTGIPTEIAGKIFDPFFTTKKPGKGTGLGLALVQRIVSLHNGAVSLEKSDRTGTTFKIEIPENEHEEDDVDTKEILLNRRMTRVLILDDDPKIRSILKFFLGEFKYPLCEASDIEEGTRELGKFVKECELVIMDWKLGTDNPHDVIKKLRTIKPRLIVIVVSGYPPIQESIQSLNIFKWITKPYDKNQLDLEIQKALYFHEKNTP